MLELYKEDASDVVIEQNLVLVYSFVRLFFVRKDNVELRDAVYTGLVKAFENGSFTRLFKNHKTGEAFLSMLKLSKRKKILIENPHLTEAFRKIPKKYFYSVEKN